MIELWQKAEFALSGLGLLLNPDPPHSSYFSCHLLDPESKRICYNSGKPKKWPLGLPLPASMPALCSIRALGACGSWLGNRHEMTLDNTWELRAEAALKLSFTKEFEGLKHVGSVWLRVFKQKLCWFEPRAVEWERSPGLGQERTKPVPKPRERRAQTGSTGRGGMGCAGLESWIFLSATKKQRGQQEPTWQEQLSCSQQPAGL